MFRKLENILDRIASHVYQCISHIATSASPFPEIDPRLFTQHQNTLVKVYFAPGSDTGSGGGIEGEGSKLMLNQGGELAHI